VGLIALGYAESGWRRTAERWGDRTGEALICLGSGDMAGLEAIYNDIQRRIPNDISFGYGQITVGLARSFELGDGTFSTVLATREALFDRERNLDITTHFYAGCLRNAKDSDPYLDGDALLLHGLIIYNSGRYHPEGDWYWEKYAGTVASYKFSLQKAHEVLGI
jgi:hypothetical protein